MDNDLKELLLNESFNNIIDSDSIKLIQLEILIALLIKRGIAFEVVFEPSTTINTVVETSTPPIRTKPRLTIQIGKDTDVTTIKKILFLDC